MCYLGARLRLLNSMNPKAECRKLSVSTINDSSKSEHAWRSSNELAKKQTTSLMSEDGTSKQSRVSVVHVNVR